jgi:hypothetical protein
VQSFRLDGTFIKESFVKRGSQGTGTAFGVALSGDPQQRFLYVADGSNERIAILDAHLSKRSVRSAVRAQGRRVLPHPQPGRRPAGQSHHGESQGYRVQKFVYRDCRTR